MISFLFSKSQNEIFKKQFEDYSGDLKIWNTTNLVFPLIIILFPSIFYFFLPEEKATFNNLILNGSFSLLGINVLFAMAIFLISSKKMNDAKMEQEIITIRQRLIIYLSMFLILGTLNYIIQIMTEINSFGKTITAFSFGLIIFYFSIGIGKRVFLIKDELIGKPIEEEIKETVSALKQSLDDI